MGSVLFMILWDTGAENLDKAIRAAKEGKFNPPPEIKPIAEYATPAGLFVQIVEAQSEEALFKYTVPLQYCHRRIDIYPTIPIEKFSELFVHQQ